MWSKTKGILIILCFYFCCFYSWGGLGSCLWLGIVHFYPGNWNLKSLNNEPQPSTLVSLTSHSLVQAEKLSAIIAAAGVEVDAGYPKVFAKALAGKDLTQLLGAIAAAGPAPAAAAPAAAAPAAAAGGAAPAAAKKEEKKEEEEEEDAGWYTTQSDRTGRTANSWNVVC